MDKVIDRKFRILAVNPCKKNAVHTEHDAVLLLAKDQACVPALDAYYTECKRLGCGEEHLNSVKLLIGRVEEYQRTHVGTVKAPDTETDCEIDRCIGGIGVEAE